MVKDQVGNSLGFTTILKPAQQVLLDVDRPYTDTTHIPDGDDICTALADGAEAWYHPYTDYVIENGLMQGYSFTVFAPWDHPSRAMMVQVLYNLEGQPYSDVPENTWFLRCDPVGKRRRPGPGLWQRRFRTRRSDYPGADGCHCILLEAVLSGNHR